MYNKSKKQGGKMDNKITKKHLEIIGDCLTNCEDWTYQENEKLEDVVVDYLFNETQLQKDILLKIVNDYFKLNPLERSNLNFDFYNFIQERI